MVADTATEVLFIGGRSGVGKTSVAAEASLVLARANVRHALIEGDNLDQAYPEPWREGIDLAERNLAAMWTNYREVGYDRLIFTNTVSVLQIPALVAALGPDVRSFGVLLTADDATAADRLARREIGTALAEHIERSALAATTLDAAAPSVRRVSTDARSVGDIALDVLAATGWLDSAPPIPTAEHADTESATGRERRRDPAPSVGAGSLRDHQRSVGISGRWPSRRRGP